MSVDLREGDVVRYAPKTDHCRDGQAIARRRRDGTLALFDTYWLSDNTVVEPEQFEIVFNLNDYRRVASHDWERYSEADRRVLHRQHGCMRDHLVRVGAAESRDQIVTNARQALADAEEEVARAVRVRDGRACLLEHLLAGGTW